MRLCVKLVILLARKKCGISQILNFSYGRILSVAQVNSSPMLSVQY